MNDNKNPGEEFLSMFAESLAMAAEAEKREARENLDKATKLLYETMESFEKAGFSHAEAFHMTKSILTTIFIGGIVKDDEDE